MAYITGPYRLNRFANIAVSAPIAALLGLPCPARKTLIRTVTFSDLSLYACLKTYW
jgi:hypothetical protein